MFPLLEEKGIQGAFFPPAKAILENKVLDVNKIHFLLAQNITTQDLLDDVFKYLDKYRKEYSLESNEYYFSKFAKTTQKWHRKEIVFIKYLLQVGLEEKLRHLIVDGLFHKHVSDDEESFSKELYMSIDQMKCMVRSGMYIGSHGYSHYWMNKIPPSVQEQEIDLSLNLLEEIGSSINNWVMCYPYGAYDSSLIEILKQKNCKLALTDISVNQGIAVLDKGGRFSLGRLDTNDLPKAANAEISDWTKGVLN